MADTPSLSKFKILAFDVFGTLIDEPFGVYKALEPLLSRLSSSNNDHSVESTHDLFSRIEASIHRDHPSLRQHDVLARVYKEIAKEWSPSVPSKAEAKAFASSMGEWPAFSDTIPALQQLSARCRLVALSNCDRETFSRVLSGPLEGAGFDAVYLAEDIGSYKPDHRNFEYLLGKVETEFGTDKSEVLMVAHGLGSDHVATKELGIESAWIERESTEEEEKSYVGRVAYKWSFKDLSDLAKDVASTSGEEPVHR